MAKQQQTERAPASAPARADTLEEEVSKLAGEEHAKAKGELVAMAGVMPTFMEEQARADQGKGVSTDQADNLVPLVYVLDPKSPQVSKHRQEYVPGAEPGDIWLKNAPEGVAVIKGGLDAEGLLFQSCYFTRCVNEWIPRNPDGSGGGFIARHNCGSAAEIAGAQEVVFPAEKPGDKPRSKWMNQDRSHEYVETREHCGYAITKMGALPYILAFSSTGHQTSRSWMPLMNRKVTPGGVKAPSWACVYRLKSYLFTRGSQAWFKLQVTDAGENGATMWTDLEGYQRGKALYEAFASGAKQAAAPEQADEPGAHDGDAPAGGDGMKGDQIPF